MACPLDGILGATDRELVRAIDGGGSSSSVSGAGTAAAGIIAGPPRPPSAAPRGPAVASRQGRRAP